jgi:tRNA/rRNA methyltransferase
LRVNPDHITIILVETQIPENIGATARAMHNMGLHHLTLVNPKDRVLTRVLKTATGTSIDIVQDMQVFYDLKNALDPFHYVVGTTARTGAIRPALTQPRRLARDLIGLSQNNRIALLFGAEDRGLSNQQLRYCHTIATIPTALFRSLNLAQAVMIFCYEIFLAGSDADVEPVTRLANKFELEGMYDHLKEMLLKIGFLDPQNPEHWMLNLRRFFSRVQLRAKEVRVIRGICRQVDWYTNQVGKLGQ